VCIGTPSLTPLSPSLHQATAMRDTVSHTTSMSPSVAVRGAAYKVIYERKEEEVRGVSRKGLPTERTRENERERTNERDSERERTRENERERTNERDSERERTREIARENERERTNERDSERERTRENERER
jgi:hypothetical protein